jgi:hypothetical protein
MIAKQNHLSQQALLELSSGQEETVLKGFQAQPQKVRYLKITKIQILRSRYK